MYLHIPFLKSNSARLLQTHTTYTYTYTQRNTTTTAAATMTTTRRRAALFPLLLLSLSSLVPYSHAFFLFPSASPITPTHLAAGKQSPEPPQEVAEEEGAGGGIISGLFSIFFGKKEAKPLGFDRISVESSPEVYPATTTVFADPLPGR
jgi:hypothetical protein